MLQAAQNIFGCVPLDVQEIIADGLGVTLSEVYGVATFYNQFRFENAGKYHIMLCRGTACHVKGSAAALEFLERCLQIHPGETTPDGLFSLEITSCLGACGLAPVMSINGEIHACVDEDRIRAVLDSIRKAEGADV